MGVLGRVQKGRGQGTHSQTLTEPAPPRRVGGFPAGFLNEDLAQKAGLYNPSVACIHVQYQEILKLNHLILEPNSNP